MTVSEQWQAWRGAESGAVSVDDYLAWVADLADSANDGDGLFEIWRGIPDGAGLLRRALKGEFVAMGKYNQVFLGMFFALYQVLQGRKCFIVSSQQMPMALLRAVNRRLESMRNLNIRMLGTVFGGDHVYLGDCQGVDIAYVDYYQFMSSLRRNPEQFMKTAQSIFILDFDVCLYDTRLVLLERGIERAGALIYKSPQKFPDGWVGAADHVDSPLELDRLEGIVLCGSYSYSDPFSAQELMAAMPRTLKDFRVRRSPGVKTLAYSTNQSRASALVSDIMKSEGNALVVCCTPEVRQAICDELKKSGQEFMLTSTTMDCLTFFTQSEGQEDKKKVVVLRGNPSPFVLPSRPLCRGALYIAEHFVALNMHEKSVAVSEGLFEETNPVRLYISQEDALFRVYGKKGEFEKMFSLMDFTEKYDPWRQIRRVLAVHLKSKLHSTRVACAETTPPQIVSMLDTKPLMEEIVKNRPKRLSKLDAPCFCGSGKPFRECHGKLQK